MTPADDRRLARLLASAPWTPDQAALIRRCWQLTHRED